MRDAHMIQLWQKGHARAQRRQFTAKGLRIYQFVILASDHDKGTYLPIDLSDPPTPASAMSQVKWLAQL